jgi:hypothetical protein
MGVVTRLAGNPWSTTHHTPAPNDQGANVYIGLGTLILIIILLILIF